MSVTQGRPETESLARTTTLVVVDDRPEVRLLLRTALPLMGGLEIVGEAGSGDEAVQMVLALSPVVVIFDLNLPDMTGDEAVRRIRVAGGTPKVVIFSARDRDDAALLEPVDAYVVKDGDLSRLMDAIEAVAQTG